MNTDDPWPDLAEAEPRVLRMQAKMRTNGRPTTLIVGLLTCSTSLPIHASSRSHGIGCGAIVGHGRPESME